MRVSAALSAEVSVSCVGQKAGSVALLGWMRMLCVNVKDVGVHSLH